MARQRIPNYGNRGSRGGARGGQGGMDMNKLMREAQQMQANLESAQEKAKLIEASASAGGGTVKVVASGDLRIRELVIDPSALDPEDVELLQDMILAAINDALSSASEAAEKEVAQATGLGGLGGADPLASLGLGGLGGLL